MKLINFIVHGNIPSPKNTLLRSKNGRMFYAKNGVPQYKSDFNLQVPHEIRGLNIEGNVSVELTIHRKDFKKDPHNLQIMVFDCLEHSGIIKNDRQITEWSGKANEIDKKNPRVEIKLYYKEN